MDLGCTQIPRWSPGVPGCHGTLWSPPGVSVFCLQVHHLDASVLTVLTPEPSLQESSFHRAAAQLGEPRTPPWKHRWKAADQAGPHRASGQPPRLPSLLLALVLCGYCQNTSPLKPLASGTPPGIATNVAPAPSEPVAPVCQLLARASGPSSLLMPVRTLLISSLKRRALAPCPQPFLT